MNSNDPPRNLGPMTVPPLPARSNRLSYSSASNNQYPPQQHYSSPSNNPYPPQQHNSSPSNNQYQAQQHLMQNGGPPLPPRQTSPLVGRPGFQSGYGGGSYGYTGMSGLSPYRGTNPYQYTPMSRYPHHFSGYGLYGGESGFIDLAEQSAIPAFQSIESIVHAFGSVSMMLESSYHAVRASFQAVLGVAEHFTKMKVHISQVFSALATFRLVKYLYEKLVFLLGRRGTNPDLREYVWRRESDTSLTEKDLKAPVNWPILLYLGLTVAAPYLIWKLLGSVNREEQRPAWEKGEGEHYIAKAVHPFNSQQDGDLSFGEGQMLVLAPRTLQPRVKGWLLAFYEGNTGMVPANYINIIARREGPTRKEDLGVHLAATKPDILKNSPLAVKDSPLEEPELDSVFNGGKPVSESA